MSISLPTEPTVIDNDLGSKTMMIYGPPKIGKSTFASRFPGAFFLECEPGLAELSTYKQTISNWSEFVETCRVLATTEHEFKTLIIDTVDFAYRYCEDYVCANEGVAYVGDSGYGKGFALAKNEWLRVMRGLTTLPMGIVFTSHAVNAKVPSPLGIESMKTTCSLPERARTCTTGLCDIIVYADSIVGDDGAEQRVLTTQGTPLVEAGLRGPQMPAVIPFSYQSFLDAWNARISS